MENVTVICFYNNPHTNKNKYKDQKINQNGPRFLGNKRSGVDFPTVQIHTLCVNRSSQIENGYLHKN